MIPVQTDVESSKGSMAGRDVDKRLSPVPKFSQLATSASVANGLVIALLLLSRRLDWAEGVAGGLAVGLIIYWSLHFFAEHAFTLLVPRHSGAASQGKQGYALSFALMTGGKFIVVGILLYVMVVVMHISLVALLAGFLLTQICISVQIINRLASTKVTD